MKYDMPTSLQLTKSNMEMARLQLYLKLAIECDTPNDVLVKQYEDRQKAELKKVHDGTGIGIVLALSQHTTLHLQ